MLSKVIIIIFLLVILYSLGSSFYLMMKDKGTGDRALKRLGWRVAFSILLLILFYVMVLMGWINLSGGPINLSNRG